ncbi:acyltransferase family protein [Gracilibacillus alcaliphilus]|uniref:acyltransferase family protein n=1 Tax=Gracilibacillus alcaliphilus TaxID=1401441 RepID=UPI00195931F1|nr:acyltransferase family protein [Gracilibacillus alcaliphilus]MBM7679786.1 fucose 4-O-acetylase-like acetyltransferase [Gracilibacillus alcaliphilus]
MKTYSNERLPSVTKKTRLVFLDNIKVALILLVVAHHAGQAYGATDYWPIRSSSQSSILGPFFDVNGAYFMGLFFFISAYFFPISVDRKGIPYFLKGRFLRLGIPFAFMTIMVFGPITYFVDSPNMSFWQYIFGVYIGQGDFEVAHLWFLALLLSFAVCYAILRLAIPQTKNNTESVTKSLGHRALLIFALLLAVVNYIIRIWFPVGQWVDILPFMPVEIGRLPQYLSFFIMGVFAYRRNWLHSLPTRIGIVWLIIGIAAAVLHYLNTLTGMLPASFNIWPILEAFIGVGFITGLLVICRDFWNRRGKLLTFMADNAYTVYLIHIIIVYLLQGIMGEIYMAPFIKFIIVSIVGMILSFVISHFIRKIPFVKMIL